MFPHLPTTSSISRTPSVCSHLPSRPCKRNSHLSLRPLAASQSTALSHPRRQPAPSPLHTKLHARSFASVLHHLRSSTAKNTFQRLLFGQTPGNRQGLLGVYTNWSTRWCSQLPVKDKVFLLDVSSGTEDCHYARRSGWQGR